MFNENVRGCKDNKVVDKRPQVKLDLDARHDFMLEILHRFGVVLKSESLMLIVNQ